MKKKGKSGSLATKKKKGEKPSWIRKRKKRAYHKRKD